MRDITRDITRLYQSALYKQPANRIHRSNVCLLLEQRRRRWANDKQALDLHLEFMFGYSDQRRILEE